MGESEWISVLTRKKNDDDAFRENGAGVGSVAKPGLDAAEFWPMVYGPCAGDKRRTLMDNTGSARARICSPTLYPGKR